MVCLLHSLTSVSPTYIHSSYRFHTIFSFPPYPHLQHAFWMPKESHFSSKPRTEDSLSSAHTILSHWHHLVALLLAHSYTCCLTPLRVWPQSLQVALEHLQVVLPAPHWCLDFTSLEGLKALTFLEVFLESVMYLYKCSSTLHHFTLFMYQQWWQPASIGCSVTSSLS